MLKRILIILGVMSPFILLIIIIRAVRLNNEIDDAMYNDTFEIDGCIYRFSKRLNKKQYERLRDSMGGKQCTKYHALEDYIVDVNTLEVKKSKWYNEYYAVY